MTSSAQPMYLPIPSRNKLKTVLQKFLSQYNEQNVVMNLELFGAAMEHVVRIVRIIEQPNGNALLVGVGGSGKQSLSRLASYICGYDVFQISVSQSYTINDLKTDLQELYKKTAVKGIPVSFILTDSQIVDDKWLVFINDILSSGFIPELFNHEDLEGIFNALRNEAKSHDVAVEDPAAMMNYFIQKVKSNLHMVLCFSPVGEVFRKRARKFLALTTCTSIDWFHPWPQQALESVAYRFLQEADLENDKIRKQIALHMAKAHITANEASEKYLLTERRYNYTTPKTYLELIEFYKKLLAEKRNDLESQITRLQTGITTLKRTHKDVEVLKTQLKTTLVKVEEKAKKAEALIKKIGIERKKVEAQEQAANIEAAKAKEISDHASALKAECDNDLAAALPAHDGKCKKSCCMFNC